MTPQVVSLSVSGGETITLGVIGPQDVSLEMEQVHTIYQDERPAYDGPYTVTPGVESQILGTINKRMLANVVVSAIPQNYGLVAWNGSFLTIS